MRLQLSREREHGRVGDGADAIGHLVTETNVMVADRGVDRIVTLGDAFESDQAACRTTGM
jgi:hypothetical protein